MSSPAGIEQPQHVDTARVDADYTGYVQQTTIATSATLGLVSALDRVQSKLDGMSNRAGNRFLGGGFGLGAALSADIAIAARYEKQMDSIRATNEITGQSFSQMSRGIDTMATHLPVARRELIDLYTQAQNLGVRTPADLQKVTTSVVKLAAATGEPAGGLLQGVTQFARSMGTDPVRNLDRYSSALLNVTKQQGVSASGTLDFAQAIAPYTRAVGISATDTLGFAASFKKAGADGYAAANVFNTMLADISKDIQTGSPDLAKYSNLLGVTTDQFKAMDRTQSVVDIFKAINKEGSGAQFTLSRLGFDGIRAAKAITQISQASGGLEGAIGQSRYGAAHPELLNQAAKQAMNSLADDGQKLFNIFESVSVAFGNSLLPAVEKFAHLLTMAVAPAAAVAKALAPILGPVSATAALALLVGGGMLKAYKTASLVAGGIYAGRSGLVEGTYSGYMAGRATVSGAELGRNTQRWAEAAADPNSTMRPWQRGLYGRAAAVGQYFAPGGTGASIARRAAMAPLQAGEWWWSNAAQGYGEAMTPGYARQGMFGQNGLPSIAGMTSRLPKMPDWMQSQWDQTRAGLVIPVGTGLERAKRAEGNLWQRLRNAGQAESQIITPEQPVGSPTTRERPTTDWSVPYRKATPDVEEEATAQAQATKATTEHTEAVKDATKAATEGGTKMRSFGRQIGATVASLGQAVVNSNVAVAKGGGSLALTGLKGIGSALGGVGTAVSAGLAISGTAIALDKSSTAASAAQPDNLSYTWQQYDSELGRATQSVGSFADAMLAAKEQMTAPASGPATLADAKKITDADVSAATASPKLDNKAIAGLNTPDMAAAWLAANASTMDPQELQKAKIDLIRKLGQTGATTALTEYSSIKPDQAMTTLTQGIGKPKTKWQQEARPINDFLNLETAGGFAHLLPGGVAAEGGLGDNASNLLHLQTATIQQNYVANTAKQGPQAAEQERLAQTVKMFDDLKAAGADEKTFAIAVKNLASAGALPAKGVKGSTLWQAMQNGQSASDALAAQFAGKGTFGDVQGVKGAANLPNAPTLGTQAQMSARAMYLAGQYGASSDNLNNQIASSGVAGKVSLAGANAVAASAATGANTANPQVMAKGAAQLAGDTVKAAGGLEQATRSLQALMARFGGDTTNPGYLNAQAALGIVQSQQQTVAATTYSREGTLTGRGADNAGGLLGSLNAQLNLPTASQGPTYAADTQAKYAAAQGGEEQYKQYLLSFLQADRQYGIQKKRSQEDFNRQSLYAEQDYYRSVSRAEQDYHRSALYAEQDYQISVFRQRRDFNISLQRQAEDAAKSIYSPYQRAQSQFAWSPAELKTNLAAQNQLLTEQAAAVNKLRKKGLTDNSINQLQLLDPNNRQTALDFAAQASAKEIASINAQTAKRVAATKGLTQNPANDSYTRQVADYRRAANDAAKDFQRSQDRAATAFHVAMSRGAQDYSTSMSRMHQQFETAASRAMSDLNELTHQFYGNFESVVAQATHAIGRDLPGIGDAALGEINRINAAVKKAETDYQTWYTSTGPGATGVSAPATNTDARLSGATGSPGTGRAATPTHARSGGRAHHSADGNIFTSPALTWIAEGPARKEAAVPLSPTGANFMAEMVGMVVRQLSRTMVGGQSSAVTNIDQSQTIREVNVHAEDPVTLSRKLKELDRRKNLVTPKVGAP